MNTPLVLPAGLPTPLGQRMTVQVRINPTSSEVISAALSLGMIPVADPAYPPPPPNPHWRVELPGRGRRGGAIRGPRGLVLHEPLDNVRMPPRWQPAVAEHGGYCAVYLISRVGLMRNVYGQPALAAAAALESAARDGRVAGVIATVITAGDPTA